MKLIKQEAQKVGGNLIRIDKHQKPLLYKNSCHQIKASIFHVQNPQLYEEFIHWNKNRKLVIEDFKGSIEKRPFQAATSSYVVYYIKPKLNSSKTIDMKIWTEYSGFDSYFKRSEFDSLVLAHEQLHFDISEIYKRIFLKELLETKLDFFDYPNQINNLREDIQHRLRLKQDEYDAEVYKNRELLPKWSVWVNSELEKLKEYDKEDIKINR